MVCSVLRAELNSGYEEIAEALIVEAEGQPVRSLRHLIEIIESRDTGLLVLEAVHFHAKSVALVRREKDDTPPP